MVGIKCFFFVKTLAKFPFLSPDAMAGTLFYYKHKGYKHIEAEFCPKNKHILSMHLGWENFSGISQVVKFETSRCKLYKITLILKSPKHIKYVQRLICILQDVQKGISKYLSLIF